MSEPKNNSLHFLNRISGDAIYKVMNSPVGKLTVMAQDQKIVGLFWEKDWDHQGFVVKMQEFTSKGRDPLLIEACKQVREYFQGKRKEFDLPLKLHGTEFQVLTWKQLQKIGYGKTISYQDQAIALGDKNRVRAVGGANGKNPISIIVPCHRVIAKSGALHGFGGGLENKQKLLDLERSNLLKNKGK